MAKPPTKQEFKQLLEREITAWDQRTETLGGTLKEQAIGRREECLWLLKVFEGRAVI